MGVVSAANFRSSLLFTFVKSHESSFSRVCSNRHGRMFTTWQFIRMQSCRSELCSIIISSSFSKFSIYKIKSGGTDGMKSKSQDFLHEETGRQRQGFGRGSGQEVVLCAMEWESSWNEAEATLIECIHPLTHQFFMMMDQTIPSIYSGDGLCSNCPQFIPLSPKSQKNWDWNPSPDYNLHTKGRYNENRVDSSHGVTALKPPGSRNFVGHCQLPTFPILHAEQCTATGKCRVEKKEAGAGGWIGSRWFLQQTCKFHLSLWLPCSGKIWGEIEKGDLYGWWKGTWLLQH